MNDSQSMNPTAPTAPPRPAADSLPAPHDPAIRPDDRILITGANGFLGSRVAASLLRMGYTRLRCLVRSAASQARLQQALADLPRETVEVVPGNLLSPADCRSLAQDVSAVCHLAAGTGTKSFPDAFLNSVVTTRNLLEAVTSGGALRRFVNVSSLAVYSNAHGGRWAILDETSPVDPRPEARGEAYAYAKLKQDELVQEYVRSRGLPCVTVRPGVVYGPGKHSITGRVGIDTFGFFAHFGGSNQIPFTYVENCADAIALATVTSGIDGEVFNIIDDSPPTSRDFLRRYKKEVRSFRSVYVPRPLSYLFCAAWERYSRWSHNQLPPVFSRQDWLTYWKPTRYSNRKAREKLGWQPRVSPEEGLARYFAAARSRLKP